MSKIVLAFYCDTFKIRYFVGKEINNILIWDIRIDPFVVV